MRQRVYGFWDKLPTAKPLAWVFTLFVMWLVGSSYISGKEIPTGGVTIMTAMGPTMIISYMGKSLMEHKENIRAEIIEEECEDDTTRKY